MGTAFGHDLSAGPRRVEAASEMESHQEYIPPALSPPIEHLLIIQISAQMSPF